MVGKKRKALRVKKRREAWLEFVEEYPHNVLNKEFKPEPRVITAFYTGFNMAWKIQDKYYRKREVGEDD